MLFGDDTLDPANNPDIPMIDKRLKGRGYKRQLALIEVVIKTQRECEHTLIAIGANLIVCSECSALWVK